MTSVFVCEGKGGGGMFRIRREMEWRALISCFDRDPVTYKRQELLVHVKK